MPSTREIEETVSAYEMACHDLEDAHHAIEYASGWIRAADTKAALLSATVALIITMASAESGPLASAGDGLRRVIVILTWCGMLTALVSLAATITSRARPGPIPSRFAFPTLAAGDSNRVSLDRSQVAEEAWAQAQDLASIAAKKHRAVSIASWATFGSLLLVLLLLGLAL